MLFSFTQVAPFSTSGTRIRRYTAYVGRFVMPDCSYSWYYYSNLWRVDPFFKNRVPIGYPRVSQNSGSVMDRRNFAYHHIRYGWPVLVTAYDAFFKTNTVAVATRYRRRTRWYRICYGIICGKIQYQHSDFMYLKFPFQCGTCRNGWYSGNGITNRALVALY